MDTQKIGRFIADARKKKKLTQTELGEYLNVTDKAVSKWECGKCLPDSWIHPIASGVLGICIISNMGLKGSINPSLKNSLLFSLGKLSIFLYKLKVSCITISTKIISLLFN